MNMSEIKNKLTDQEFQIKMEEAKHPKPPEPISFLAPFVSGIVTALLAVAGLFLTAQANEISEADSKRDHYIATELLAIEKAKKPPHLNESQKVKESSKG